MGNLHQRVVDGDDVVVNGHARRVAAGERTRIGSLTVSLANSTGPANDVVEAQRAIGDPQAHCERLAFGRASGAFGTRMDAAAAGVYLGRCAAAACCAPLRVAPCAEAAEALPRANSERCVRDKSPGARTGDRARAGLRRRDPRPIRGPASGRSSMSCASWRTSLRSTSVSSIRSRKGSAIVAREEPVIECSAGIAYVEESCGRRRKSDTN